MEKKKVFIKFQNGITKNIAEREILSELLQEFEFVETGQPKFILFGPYGEDIPLKGDYTRIGYFCENMWPDFSTCEYALGIPPEQHIRNPRYKRIQWHGLDPGKLIKNLNENDIDRIVNTPRRFCNFLYSHPVIYREEFFRQLSRYKRVDAPGKSMNNMPSIDNVYQGNYWERKRRFLTDYKFTIAFENYAYPGYQTEKLYDAMQSLSLPIYFGDPEISSIFNTHSFVNARDFVSAKRGQTILNLEKLAQPDFTDMLPATRNSVFQKVKRKLKHEGRKLKMKLETNKLDYTPLIEEIIEIDSDDTLYANYLREPWFKGNKVPANSSTKEFWKRIFTSDAT
ncbi:MAG: hypothetical protein K0S09_3160 [Sphingobacteriaceae bacterium]|jgi:hypothetical protein|nr:hypothetical protein [Sphingobacteriaceae bacterium]